ncbi:hypothetical protein BDZ94DRAFT_1261318 [Collybia nuda]|uniref:Uncharacterized protein n=1 Tax=Collybia nuda TaxID=64659 RepID=A0A9P5Y551_9AGAR|nr:hypothetical protein BDZ94DRAFT_1261318 [Collybia nuda]
MSSPRMSSGPPSQSRSRHGPVQSVPPTRARSRSPPIFYDNVSYSRGASSTPRSSPRDARRASPRVVVETPIDLASYASDTESSTSASSYQEFSPLTRHSSRNHTQISTPHRRTPSSPLTSKERFERRTPRMVGRVTVETPPGLKHYPTDEEDASDYYTPVHKSVQASSPLSPISSPWLRTPKDADLNAPTSRSSIPRSRTSSSASISSKFSPKLPPGIPPVNIYFICPEAHHSHCHRCEEYPTRYAASSISQFGLSHSIRSPTVQGVSEIDPRSPLSRSGSAHSALFTRPSPINVEEQMSNMFL